MTICSQCGRQNEANFYFCSGCGANLKAQRATEAAQSGGLEPTQASTHICGSCGQSVPLSHLFCGSCGARQRPRTMASEAVPDPLAEPPQRAHLVLINPDGSSGESVPLKVGENVFGRDHGPEAFSDDPFLSPQHVAFHLDGPRLQVRDLDSLNGVFCRLNEATELRHQDFVRIGRQLLRFEVLDQLAAVVPADGSDTRALGAPRGDAWGRLVRISAPGKSSQAFLLTGPEEVIGRERGTILLRDDGFVSGRHARLTTSGTRYHLEDLRSSNGTFVRVRTSKQLESGDLLLIGQQPLRVVLDTA